MKALSVQLTDARLIRSCVSSCCTSVESSQTLLPVEASGTVDLQSSVTIIAMMQGMSPAAQINEMILRNRILLGGQQQDIWGTEKALRVAEDSYPYRLINVAHRPVGAQSVFFKCKGDEEGAQNYDRANEEQES